MKQYMHYLKNIFQRNFIFISIVLLTIYSCKNGKTEVTSFEESSAIKTPENMVWVESKTFLQGAKDGDKYAMPREMPAHEVTVDGFFMDITEVTNRQFKAFFNTTGYITVAERPIDWEQMKKELPEGTIHLYSFPVGHPPHCGGIIINS